LEQNLVSNLIKKEIMKKYSIILSGLIFLTACDDFLKENPKAIASETFYTTASEMESAVYSAYDPLIGTVFMRNYHTINESQTDYGYGRGSYASTSDFAGLDATTVGRVGDLWTGFYLSIRNANIVISNAERALSNGVGENKVNELVGEAKFIRAFNYFHLVVNWAGVPLRTEENMAEQHVARSNENAVYQLIIEDLTFAEQYLPDTPAMTGRPSKWAAKTMLADVYLTRQEWDKARAKAGEVINSNKYKLVDVMVPDDYYKIFGHDIVSSTEEIFYIKYTGTRANNFVAMLHAPGTGYYGTDGGAYGLYTDAVTNKVIDDWDSNDLRKTYNLYNWDIGLGSENTLLFKKFIEPDKTLGLSCDFPRYRYADVLLFYAEADCMANGAPTEDGMEKLNMIHRRGYGKNIYAPSEVDFKLSDYNSQDSFWDLVLQERMYETLCEAKRYYDLKRTGKIKQIIKETKGIDVADKHLLWPIPNAEYLYNDLIDDKSDQNPGY
jgi:hypothetical protein